MSQRAEDSGQTHRLSRSSLSNSFSPSRLHLRTPFGEKNITPVTATTTAPKHNGTLFRTTDDTLNLSQVQDEASGDNSPQTVNHISRIKHYRTSEADEIEQMRKRLKDAQFEVSTTRTELELKIITLEQTLRTTNLEKDKLARRVDELQSQRRFLFEKEKRSSSTAQSLEEQLNEYKETSDKTIRTLDEEVFTLKESLAVMTERHRQTESLLNQKVQELQDTLSYQEATMTQIRDSSESQSHLAEDKHRQLSDAIAKIANLELENRQLKQKELEFQHVDWARKELQNQVSYGRQLETKNRQLVAECNHYKEMYRNAEVLKEEKTALQQKLTMLDDLRVKYGMLEVQNGVLRKEKQQWLAFLNESDSKEFNSPHDLAKTIALLRREQSALISTNGELEAALRSRDSFINQLETQLQNVKRILVEQEQKMATLSAEARRSEQSKALALRQVENLKEQLKSYDTEEATLMGGSFDNSKNIRVAELEKLVEEYHGKLEAAIAQASHRTEEENSLKESENIKLLQTLSDNNALTFDRLSREKQQIFEAKNNLEIENARLKSECASLEANVDELELSIGAGAFNPATSRVLEIKDSPAARYQAVRQHMLDSLREENTALLKSIAQLQRRLDALSEGGAAVAGSDSMDGDDDTELPESSLIPAATLRRLEDDYARLREELENAKKRSKRMEEIWETKSDEYLEVVEALLGYRFNFLEDGRVEVVSVYDTVDRRSFVFASGDNDQGTMQLVGTGSNRYVDAHREETMRLLQEIGSIPAFLSQVTLDAVGELGQKWTSVNSSS
ncbi:coiled-coil domain-containing protein mad1 [Podila epigama]|nr:coiled-coil domain-containing protein mad1 [Podila epigama]